MKHKKTTFGLILVGASSLKSQALGSAVDLAARPQNWDLSNGDSTNQGDGHIVDQRGRYQIGEKVPISISWDEEVSDIKPHKKYRKHVYHLTHPGASYISLHFKSMDMDPGCSMNIKGPPTGHKKEGQSYVMRGKGKFNLGSFWTHHTSGDSLSMVIHCNEENEKASFEVDQYAAGFPDLYNSTLQAWEHEIDEDFERFRRRAAICGSDDSKNAICYSDTTVYKKSRAVARLYIDGTSACTGFLVGPTKMTSKSLLLTNAHCITSNYDAQNTDYEFMGEDPACESTSGNCWMCDRGDIYDGLALLQTSGQFDYALVELVGNPASDYGYLELESRNAVVGETIYIPQHPKGRAKEIATFDSQLGSKCKITQFAPPCRSNQRDNDVGYTCDTDVGSSGAPVISNDGHKVVAIHHCANCPNRGVPISLFFSEIEGYFQSCFSNAHCDDGDACNGIETCSVDKGLCLPGTPLTCEKDDNMCTINECNSITGSCGVPVVCNDNDSCTDDSCDSSLGCIFTAIPGCNSLKTKLMSTTGQAGNMFDIKSLSYIEVSGFEIHCDNEGGLLNIHVYMHKGTWKDTEKSPHHWNEILFAPAVKCVGLGSLTALPNFPLPVTVTAGNTVAFYITAETSNIQYTTGTAVGR
eukprot:5487772-Ditylum_brightwellii.AAC.1